MRKSFLVIVAILTVFSEAAKFRAYEVHNGWPEPTGSISFFTGASYTGYSYADNYSPGCHQMPKYFQRNVNSIHTSNRCIKIFDDPRCLGTHVTPRNWFDREQNPIHKYRNLGLIWSGREWETWNDRILSWMPC